MLDDEVIVMQAEQRRVHGFVEGPCVGRVLPTQQLLQDGIAVAQLPVQLGAVLRDAARSGHLGQILARWFDGPTWHRAPHDGLQVHRVGRHHSVDQAGDGREREGTAAFAHADCMDRGGQRESGGSAGGGGVCFTLHAFLLMERKRRWFTRATLQIEL